VPRVKPIFVIVWIAFGLVAMAHCPLDALGDFSESLSCMAGAVAAGHSAESVESDDSHGALACRLINRTKGVAPVAIAKSDYSRLTRWPTNAAIKRKMPGGEISFLLANCQFWRRTAHAARAP
jgi:hypothetical protein